MLLTLLPFGDRRFLGQFCRLQDILTTLALKLSIFLILPSGAILPTPSLIEKHCSSVYGDRVRMYGYGGASDLAAGKQGDWENPLIGEYLREGFVQWGWFFFSGYSWGLLMSPDPKWSSS